MLKRIIPYLRYLWHITEGFHGSILLRTLAGVLKVCVMLAFVWFSKTAVDCATGRVPAETATLVRWFSLMVACMLTDVALSQWIRYTETRTVTLMNNRVNRRLFNILMDRPLINGRQGFHSGDMINRLTLDVRTVSRFALSQLPTMVVMAVQLVGAFLFLAWMNPYLALAPLVIMPVCLVAGKLFFRRNRRLMARIRELESDMHVSIQEGLKHRTVLKSLECVGEVDNRLGGIQQNIDDANRAQARLSTVSGGMTRVGFILGYLTAFGWSIFSLKAGIISFGTMTAFIQLVNRIQSPIAGVAGYLPSFISTSVAIDRLREIEVRSEVRGQRSVVTSSLVPLPGVRIKDLSYRYEAGSREILSGFSHDFRPGSRTMIVGATGAGKTTLIKLLLGLLSPDKGEIEIYGEGETRKVSLETIGNFVYVPQGNSLLPGTVRENLLLADSEASEERLAEVLHVAAADFVHDLPMGLDTPCDEAGGGLSEGQAQRVAIARALLRPGSILLLDEFNSALDADTADTLMQRLLRYCRTATVIIIAHHQSTVAPYCDTVLRL